MLLTELDELAIKQGEEEAKKLESDTDGRSSKSRLKSPISADYSGKKHCLTTTTNNSATLLRLGAKIRRSKIKIQTTVKGN